MRVFELLDKLPNHTSVNFVIFKQKHSDTIEITVCLEKEKLMGRVTLEHRLPLGYKDAIMEGALGDFLDEITEAE